MCDESKRKEFFDCLKELIDKTENLRILIGMRSDFRGRLREHPEFAVRINKPYINVEHLNREEIEEAITKPADWVGLGIEGTLKQQLINDVEDYPGSLPLLQYTLTELWRESRKQGDEFLRLKTYQDLGGVEGTLQKRADEVYNGLKEPEKIVVRRIFLELTQIGETTDTRRRVRLHELVNSHNSLELLQQVSEKLADKDTRLITKTESQDSHDVILDVVHEALLRHWTHLNEWKRQYQNAIALERKIEAAAKEWEKAGKPDNDPGWLLQGGRLAEAEEYKKEYDSLGMLDGVAQEYIKKSQELRDRQRQEEEERKQREEELQQRELQAAQILAEESEARRRAEEEARKQAEKALRSAKTRNRVLTIFGISLAGLTIFAFYQWNDAQKNTINALAQTSEASLLSNRQLEAMVSAIQAGRRLENPFLFPDTAASQTVNATLQRAVHNVQERNRLEGHSDALMSVAFSRDGKTIASGSGDKSVKLSDVATEKVIATLNGHSNAVWSVGFSPDGKTIASGSGDKSVKLWDVATGKEIVTLNGHTTWVTSVGFSPDGKTIASGSLDRSVKLWNVATGKEIATLNGHSNLVNSVGFSPDGKTIASGSHDKSVKLWKVYPNNLKDLMVYSCDWLRAYLQSNPNVSDRTLCDGIGANSDR